MASIGDWKALDTFSDLELVCLGKPFHLHQVILATSCPYFASALSEKWKRDEPYVLCPPNFPFCLEYVDDKYSLVENAYQEDNIEKFLSSFEKVVDAIYKNDVDFEEGDLEEAIYFVIWCDYLTFDSPAYMSALQTIANRFHLVTSIAPLPVGAWKTKLFAICVETIGYRHYTPDFPEYYWEHMTLDMMVVFLKNYALFYPDGLSSARLLINLVNLWLSRDHPDNARTIIDVAKQYIQLEVFTEDELVGLIRDCEAMDVKPFVDDDFKTMLHTKYKRRTEVREEKPLDVNLVEMFHLTKDMGEDDTRVTHFAGTIFCLAYDVTKHNLGIFLNVRRCTDATKGCCLHCGYGRWETKSKVYVKYRLDLFAMGLKRTSGSFEKEFGYTSDRSQTTWGSRNFIEMSKLPQEFAFFFGLIVSNTSINNFHNK